MYWGGSITKATHQVVEFRVLAEKGPALLLLTADEVLDVHVEAGGGDAVGAQRGLLTLLEQQRQQREQRMPGERSPPKTRRFIPGSNIQNSTDTDVLHWIHICTPVW